MTNESIFQTSPLLPLALCLMAGIAVGHAFTFDARTLLFCLVLLAILLVVVFRWSHLSTLFILLATAVLGACLVTISRVNGQVPLPNHYVEYEAVVADEPVDKPTTERVDLLIVSGPLRGRSVRASFAKDTICSHRQSLGVGDGLRVYSRLKEPHNYQRSNFDYATFLRGRGFVAVTYVPDGCWQRATVDAHRLSFVDRARIRAMVLRHHLMQRLSHLGLSGQSLAVASAMSLGDKSTISEATREAYSVTGASHILALSGMHLSVIYTLLSFLSMGRRWSELRQLLLLTVIWAYVFMVGMSPSVMRSALMLSVYALVGLTGRRPMSLNALAFAAMVLLALNPLSLFDISFQLSFAAVAFILLYNRRLSGLVAYDVQQRHPVLRFVWQLLSMSMVAQLGTSPLVVYYFGRISVYFLLTNLIVIPAATVIIYLSVAVLAFWCWPFVQGLLAHVLAFVTAILNTVLLYLSHLPGASIEGVQASAVQIAMVYVLIFILLRLLFMCRVFHRRY